MIDLAFHCDNDAFTYYFFPAKYKNVFFENNWNHTFICHIFPRQKSYDDNNISFSAERTLNLLLANLSFLSISQPFWKLGQTSDTTHSSRRSIWLWGEFKHRGGSVAIGGSSPQHPVKMITSNREQIQPGFEKYSQTGLLLCTSVSGYIYFIKMHLFV